MNSVAPVAVEAVMPDPDVQALRGRERSKGSKISTSIVLLEYRVGQLEGGLKQVHADHVALISQLRESSETQQEFIAHKFSECQMIRRQESALIESERARKNEEHERQKAEKQGDGLSLSHPWVSRAIGFAVGIGATVAGFFGLSGGAKP